MRQLSSLLVLLASASSIAGAQTAQPPRQLAPTRITADSARVLSVQNDREARVTVYARVRGDERKLGAVAAGQIANIALPSWALANESTLQLFVRADGERSDLVSETLPLRTNTPLGLLIPPRGGLATNDSLVVKLNADELASTTLTVNNPRAGAVTVYAEQGTLSVKLGEVAANTQSTLQFPKALLARNAAIRVFVRPLVGAGLATQSLTVKDGDHLGLLVSM